MDEPTPGRRQLRGVPLLVARIVALGLSLGVVTLVAVNAGFGGCRSAGPGIEAEAPSPDDPVMPVGSAPQKGEEGFMGGAKAPAGGWARPRPAPQPAAQAPAAPTLVPTSDPAADSDDEAFLGGSKAPAGRWARPPAKPAAQAPAPPAQGNAP